MIPTPKTPNEHSTLRSTNFISEKDSMLSYGNQSYDNEDISFLSEIKNNTTQTYCRINPLGASVGAVFIDPDLDELCLAKEPIEDEEVENSDTWPIHGIFDLISNPGNESSSPKYILQSEVWTSFSEWFNQRHAAQSGSLAAVAFGCFGSGKSYTLFGDSTSSSDKGIIPRWLEHIFDPSSVFDPLVVQFSMMMIVEEEIYDILQVMNGWKSITIKII